MSDALYRLVEVNPQTNMDVKSTPILTLLDAAMHIDRLLGVSEASRFFVLKVPKVGAPSEAECATMEDLMTLVAEFTSGEVGQIFIYKGIKVVLGSVKHAIPMTIGTEETLVPVTLPDPPQPEPKKETSAEPVEEEKPIDKNE